MTAHLCLCGCGLPAPPRGFSKNCGTKRADYHRAEARRHYYLHRSDILAAKARQRAEHIKARLAAGLDANVYRSHTVYPQLICRVPVKGWGCR